MGDHSIDVSERTYRRFEQRREATKNDSLPEMTPDVFLNALLDTHEAAGSGYYADDDEPGDWREEIQTRDAAETCPECGADLVESLGSDPACPSCGWSK